MHLKGRNHTHTTCSDGKLTPQEVADVYAELGYDFIAFTDHDYLLKHDHQLLYEKVRSSLIIFKGIEHTVFEKGYVHVGHIWGDREELYVLNHLGEYDLTYEQVKDRIAGVAERYPLSAVEITTKGFPEKEFDVDDIGYPRLASDDAHTRIGCGRAWIELDCKREPDAIIKAIKAGFFWNCYAK